MAVSLQIGRKKRIVLISLAVIVLTSLLCFALPLFSAAEDTSKTERTSLEESMESSTSELIIMVSGYDIYTILGVSSETVQAIDAVASKVSKALSGIGCVLIIFMVIYAIINEVLHGDNSFEMWLRVFIKFAVGMCVLIWTDDIIDALQVAGEYIVQVVSAAINAFEAGSWTDITGTTHGDTQTMLSSILSTFLLLYIKIVSYTLIIEMAIRRAFAPIAVVSIVTQGVRSPAVRYFKKYLVIYIKMALMVLVMKLGAVILAEIYKTEGSVVETLMMLCILASCVTFIGKGSTLADQIMGTN